MNSNGELQLSNDETLLIHLGDLIGRRIAEVAGERQAPRHDADASDDIIKVGQADIAELRMIRQQLERIIYGDPGV